MLKSLLLHSILGYLAPAVLGTVLSPRTSPSSLDNILTETSSPGSLSDSSVANSTAPSHAGADPNLTRIEEVQILINPDRYVKIFVNLRQVIGLDRINSILDGAADGLRARPQDADMDEFAYNERSPGATSRGLHMRNYLVHGPRLTNGEAFNLIDKIFKTWILGRSRMPSKPLSTFGFEVRDRSQQLAVAGGILSYLPLPPSDGISSNVLSS